MTNYKKTKNQSMFEYLESLQYEYLSFELRSKIYPVPQKEYWKLVLSQKKKNIEDISTRNRLSTIFNDDYTRLKMSSVIYSEPKFLYRNEIFRTKWEGWDWHNYFLKDSEVTYTFNGVTGVGVIKRYYIYEKKVVIFSKDEEREITLEQSNVKRIL